MMTIPEIVETTPFPSGAGARVVLIMPVRNEERNLLATLHSLLGQTLDHARMVLYVVDGSSTDATCSIAQSFLDEHDVGGAVIPNPRRSIPSGLNAGIRQARPTDIIVRLDGHTLYGPTYLSELIGLLESAPQDVACVGGPQVPTSDDSFEHRLVGTLYSNPMGLGGAEHRVGQAVKYVKQVYLGAWRPGVLQRLGGFDERWCANEDSELSARIVRANWRILWAPLDCTYSINRGVAKSIRQWGGYGYWRAQTLRRYPELAKPRHFAPPVAYALALALLFTKAWPLVIAGAVAFAGLVVAKRAKNDSIALALAGAVFFPLCQLAWSIGLLRGLLAPAPPFRPFLSASGQSEGPSAARRMGNIRGSWQEEQQGSDLERDS